MTDGTVMMMSRDVAKMKNFRALLSNLPYQAKPCILLLVAKLFAQSSKDCILWRAGKPALPADLQEKHQKEVAAKTCIIHESMQFTFHSFDPVVHKTCPIHYQLSFFVTFFELKSGLF